VKAEDKASVEQLASALGTERNVVERIRAELARRGWTQAELSRRMEEHAEGTTGGVLHPVVLSKLLGGDRGRHVSIDQLVTLAGVFEVSVAEMLLPPAAMETAEVLRAMADGPRLQRESDASASALARARDLIAHAMLTSSFWREHVADALESALRDAERQGRPIGDSLRMAFLGAVSDRYWELKQEDEE
jgi:transcriptional regulator with XRE-family HTH domain